MNLSTLATYQVGQRRAIEAVAENRGSFWTGLILVLVTAVARHYDQSFILEESLWLLGPLLFSLLSGTFLFLVLNRFASRYVQPSQEAGSSRVKWRVFMGLFWCTAPIAWLYAMPVERVLGPYEAAEANAVLLLIVAIWRVLLMSRVISVLHAMSYTRALGWVLVPACIEVAGISIMAFLFSPGLGARIASAMGGIRPPPESAVLGTLVGFAFWGAIILLVVVSLLLEWTYFDQSIRPLPKPNRSRIPWVLLLALAVGWTAVAIPAQKEQHRFVTHSRLIKEGKHREAVEFLARYQRADFPPLRRFEPDPYSYEVFEKLPKVMSAVKSTDPAWIRMLYLGHFTTIFEHQWFQLGPEPYAEMLSAIETWPESKGWVQQNKQRLEKLRVVAGTRPGHLSEERQKAAAETITNALERLGFRL